MIDPHSSALGLCLTGGGVTGAMYQVGCLAAIEEVIDPERARPFRVYVGSSSGATLAATLAAGISPLRLYRALLDPSDDFFPLERHHLMRFHTSEWKRVVSTALSAARKLASSAAASPLELRLGAELDRFFDSMPAGIFTLDAYERFFSDFMTRRGIPERFDAMKAVLRIVAHDLDSGGRVVFGAGALADVPVARAVVASAAIPILYAPVRIGLRDFVDSGVGELAHVDVARAEGCHRVLVINPMVPVHIDVTVRDVPTGHGLRGRVRDKGLLGVYNQALRLRMEESLRDGLSRYRDKNPEASIVVLEPAQADATMFMYSPMNFAARRVILEYAYTSTKTSLHAPGSALRALLESTGSLRPPAST